MLGQAPHNINDTEESNGRNGIPENMLAPIWKRFLAGIIDTAILFMSTIGLFGSTSFSRSASTDELTAGTIVFSILGCLSFVYTGFCESSIFQATPGKIALGLKVTDRNGSRLPFRLASIRSIFLAGLSATSIIAAICYKQKLLALDLPCTMIFIALAFSVHMPIFHSKRSLIDKITGRTVLPKKASSSNVPPAMPPENTLPLETKYASSYKRLAAFLIDEILLLLALMLPSSILAAAVQLGERATSALPIEVYTNLPIIAGALTIVVAICYLCGFESSYQTTPGKYLLGLKVVTTSGTTMSFWSCALKLAIQCCFFLLCTMAPWTLIEAIAKLWTPESTAFLVAEISSWLLVVLFVTVCYGLPMRSDRKQSIFDRFVNRVVIEEQSPRFFNRNNQDRNENPVGQVAPFILLAFAGLYLFIRFYNLSITLPLQSSINKTGVVAYSSHTLKAGQILQKSDFREELIGNLRTPPNALEPSMVPGRIVKSTMGPWQIITSHSTISKKELTSSQTRIQGDHSSWDAMANGNRDKEKHAHVPGQSFLDLAIVITNFLWGIENKRS